MAAGLLGLAAAGAAQVVEFEDKQEWLATVGPFSTIDFTGFPTGTLVTDQYADLGVLFTDGSDFIVCCPDGFANDGAGLDGGYTSTSLQFTTPLRAIAVDAGLVQVQLFREGELIYESGIFGKAGGSFAGLVSPPFDAAILIDPLDLSLRIDDLHFGLPAPGAGWLVVAAALRVTDRRRRARVHAS